MPAQKRILVTGATGFLGREIVAAGAQKGHHMVAVSRAGTKVAGSNEQQACGDLAQGVSAIQLAGIDAMIHCAALVHQPAAPAAAYAPINVDLPLVLAKDILDWQPSIELEEGLDRTIAYFRTIVGEPGRTMVESVSLV